MALHKIRTPHNQTVRVENCTATLEWRPDFGHDFTQRFNAAQCYVDSEVLRRCSPRLPFRDGFLEKSGTLMTEIGSGIVTYGGPYAARLYNHPEYNFDTSKHAEAGGEWFERTKQDETDDILRGAKEKVGAK